MVIVVKRRRDGVKQRYHAKVKVKKYKRKTGPVKSYSRDKRKLGKKVHFQKVGVFLVAHDEQGNFRGSKVKPYKS